MFRTNLRTKIVAVPCSATWTPPRSLPNPLWSGSPSPERAKKVGLKYVRKSMINKVNVSIIVIKSIHRIQAT